MQCTTRKNDQTKQSDIMSYPWLQ